MNKIAQTESCWFWEIRRKSKRAIKVNKKGLALPRGLEPLFKMAICHVGCGNRQSNTLQEVYFRPPGSWPAFAQAVHRVWIVTLVNHPGGAAVAGGFSLRLLLRVA